MEPAHSLECPAVIRPLVSSSAWGNEFEDERMSKARGKSINMREDIQGIPVNHRTRWVCYSIVYDLSEATLNPEYGTYNKKIFVTHVAKMDLEVNVDKTTCQNPLDTLITRHEAYAGRWRARRTRKCNKQRPRGFQAKWIDSWNSRPSKIDKNQQEF